MILFCEECGQRNTIVLTPSLIEKNRFTCQFCGFHSPFPFLDQDRQSTGSNPGITWEPGILRLGPETEHTEQRFQLIFKVTDIQTPELKLEPFQEYARLIQVEKTSSDSFTVIVQALGAESVLQPGFNGAGLIYCEEQLMSWGTINISYEHHAEAAAKEEKNKEAEENRKRAESPPGKGKKQQFRDENYDLLHQQLTEYKTQLHQAKTASYRLQKELSIRRQVMDNQDCGILFINLEQRIVYANPVFLKRTGYSLKAIQSKRIDQVIRLADTDCSIKEAMKHSVQQQKWEGRAFLKDAIRQGNWQRGEDTDPSEEKPSIISFKYSDGQEEGQEKGFICLLHLEESVTPSSPLKWGDQNASNSGNHLSTELTYLNSHKERDPCHNQLHDCTHMIMGLLRLMQLQL
ncbi:MAG: PAS domain-containing protein [Candidatus Electrothrix sp. AUS1_2]|nr:PAS domain-containing protein [Candidatus Electrothrix sp. AUS1_2]